MDKIVLRFNYWSVQWDSLIYWMQRLLYAVWLYVWYGNTAHVLWIILFPPKYSYSWPSELKFKTHLGQCEFLQWFFKKQADNQTSFWCVAFNSEGIQWLDQQLVIGFMLTGIEPVWPTFAMAISLFFTSLWYFCFKLLTNWEFRPLWNSVPSLIYSHVKPGNSQGYQPSSWTSTHQPTNTAAQHLTKPPQGWSEPLGSPV